jgi:hypothetical protein
MEPKGEQIEDDEDTGQCLLAVAKVVLEVISVGLEHVESFVLDLPARTATCGDFGDGVGLYLLERTQCGKRCASRTWLSQG